jgi:hypothetical protein
MRIAGGRGGRWIFFRVKRAMLAQENCSLSLLVLSKSHVRIRVLRRQFRSSHHSLRVPRSSSFSSRADFLSFNCFPPSRNFFQSVECWISNLESHSRGRHAINTASRVSSLRQSQLSTSYCSFVCWLRRRGSSLWLSIAAWAR